MKRLYAPWRSNYVTDSGKKENNLAISKDTCVFCQQVANQPDDVSYVLRRCDLCFVMLNRYPYNGGHILVLPFDHKPDLEDLTPATRSEMIEVVSTSKRVLQNVLNPQGFNIGINLGSAGGGGIPSHLHIHIIPRWRGDTSFLETVGSTKLVSADLDDVYRNVKNGFDTLLGKQQ